jgi:hypothetical protein
LTPIKTGRRYRESTARGRDATKSEDTMTTTTNTISLYATTYHDDGSVTVWDVYRQRWLTTTHVRDEVLASLALEERERVLNHLAWTHDDA